VDPYHSQFVARVETMTEADRRLADEQAGRLARAVWLLYRGVARHARALTLRARFALRALDSDAVRHQEEPPTEGRRAACPDRCSSASRESERAR
jgi:hypothetical protein